jgi:hypothetical protein
LNLERSNMKNPKTEDHQDAVALYDRRKFLKRALATMAYVTPVLVSYSSSVFAAHCTEAACGGVNHMGMAGGGTWSPGCSRLA